MSKLKTYYNLAKPGIIYGNLLTAVAGFFFASGLEWRFDFATFCALVIGTALIIGSACAFNNYLDRNMDKKMERTKGRALVQGDIPATNAIVYASCLGILGVIVLFRYTNVLTGSLEIFGLFSYVVLYTLAKRHTRFGVHIGTLPGAVPIVAGYTAVADKLDLPALLLFLILVLWQLPHFYSISLYRSDEYAAAGIPVLPLQKGKIRTEVEMLLYIIVFIVAVLSPTFFHLTGYIYLVVMAVVGLIWIFLCARGFAVSDDKLSKWSHKMFLYSLVVIVIFSVMISVGAVVL